MKTKDDKVITELTVTYKALKGHEGVNKFLDKDAGGLANSYGLDFVGSGYNFKTKERDLNFKASFV